MMAVKLCEKIVVVVVRRRAERERWIQCEMKHPEGHPIDMQPFYSFQRVGTVGMRNIEDR